MTQHRCKNMPNGTANGVRNGFSETKAQNKERPKETRDDINATGLFWEQFYAKRS